MKMLHHLILICATCVLAGCSRPEPTLDEAIAIQRLMADDDVTRKGGEGMTFSHEHSLSTVVTYDPDDPDAWATNGIDLVTRFVGYSLTNHMHFTVGEWGTATIEKSGHVIERNIFNGIWLDGVKVN